MISRSVENRIIGELLGKDKYTFADKSLIAEVVRDTVDEINREVESEEK